MSRASAPSRASTLEAGGAGGAVGMASSVSWVGRASSAKEADGGGLGERRSSV